MYEQPLVGGGGVEAIGNFSDLSYRHATTHTQAYFGVFGFFRKFFCQKRHLTPVKSLFENTLRNAFFFIYFFYIGQNSSKPNLELKYGHSLFKSTFRISFRSGQTENTQIRVFVYFPFDHFPKLKIDSKSRFEKRMPIYLF